MNNTRFARHSAHSFLPSTSRVLVIAAILAIPFLTATRAWGQAQPLPHERIAYPIESGSWANTSGQPSVLFEHVIDLGPNVPWIRVEFSTASLAPSVMLRVTSILDGESQLLDLGALERWRHSTAYFNGSAVRVELVALTATSESHFSIEHVIIGTQDNQGSFDKTLCGNRDTRSLSNDLNKDPAIGRILPAGCTGFITERGGIDKCHLTAGNCASNAQVIQFDVPLSSPNCSLQHPPVRKQFAINQASLDFSDQGRGDDWAVFRTFRNAAAGNRTSFQEQGVALALSSSVYAGPGRVSGYGVDSGDRGGSCTLCAPHSTTGSRNQTLQTATGPLDDLIGSRLFYEIDTCGGNSGSPVFDDTTGEVVAIHTHGGCQNVGGNSGTLILHQPLRDALNACALVASPFFAIPSLSNWGQIGLVTLLGLAAILALRTAH